MLFLRSAATAVLARGASARELRQEVVALREELAGVRTTELRSQGSLSALMKAQNVEPTINEAEKNAIQLDLTKLRDELAEHSSAMEKINQKAVSGANLSMWLGALVPFGGFAVMARLTWWEFSWDIMEPITFFITAMGPLCATYAYFCFTKGEYSFAASRERAIERRRQLQRAAQRIGFDLDGYRRIQSAIEAGERELARHSMART